MLTERGDDRDHLEAVSKTPVGAASRRDSVSIAPRWRSHDRLLGPNQLLRPLLVDLRGDNGCRIGAPTAATHDADHRSGQALSAAVHRTRVDGIIFSSRFTGDTCFALFDRSLEKIRYLGTERLVNHPDVLAALERYRIELEPKE